MVAKNKTGARLVVECLKRQGVEYVFGIPGAKIDAVFDALADGDAPRLIVCRHEQNAAFMAACVGRLTGRPGVVLVTSGPGVSNLATGLITATTEGDPMVALAGAVPRAMALKQTHQSMDNVSFARPLTKSSVEVIVPETIPEVLSNAFRLAARPRGGATFVSLPQDVLAEEVSGSDWEATIDGPLGPAPVASVREAAARISGAKQPVLLLGLEASKPDHAESVRRLLEKFPVATVQTFEAAGMLSRELAPYFVGRVGLFRNQPGDQLLESADVVMTVGFSPVEYDPEVWNAENRLDIVHVDNTPTTVGKRYHPRLELIGGIAETLDALTEQLPAREDVGDRGFVDRLKAEMDAGLAESLQRPSSPIHPLRFIHDLQSQINDNTTVISDVGSHYMWLARHLYCYRPRHLLFSNGQQTLGVALPWAIAASLVRPKEQVISISGDGGFLFSAMELETAVRERRRFVHFVWRDGSYNMVAVQEKMKYGRTSGVQFGPVDLVQFAESFGAKGIALETADDIIPALQEGQAFDGPVLIDVPIDYGDNATLFANIDAFAGH
ncbi:MAG: acetolactate synthase AlsS [Candidatus Binatia bacterium]|nr:acetolactate synthase AlsS [Candidatus Binatia bacterium]